MNKFKIRTVLAFTLVIFVVSLCVPSIFGKAPQRGRRPMLQNQTRAKLHAPDLTDVQKEQLKNLHLELNELKKDTAANAVKIEKIQDEIFNLRIGQMKNAPEKPIHEKGTAKGTRTNVWSQVFFPKRNYLASLITEEQSLEKRAPEKGLFFCLFDPIDCHLS